MPAPPLLSPPAALLLPALFLTVSIPAAAQTALDAYVSRPDPNFAWTLVDRDDGLLADTYLLNMTSQRWRSAAEVDRPVWRHDLTLADPNFTLCGDNDSRETAILLINGGGNPVSDRLDDDAAELAQIAATTFCSVVAIVDQVPNQPLNFSDEFRRPRSEDAILAYSFSKFLDTGDPDWPVHLAMTKAAVAAMDAVQQFSRADNPVPDVDDFIVMGGSKRGWTSWLTAAVDARVKAVIPVSIDMLNLARQFRHHWEAYGFYAPAVNDYHEFDIGCRLDSERGRALLASVDPLSYADRYVMPKLVINSAGDQFFVSDSSRFYYGRLPGPKWLRYTANTDHGQGDSDDVFDLLLEARSWIDDINDGKSPPRYDWRFSEDGAIVVEVADPGDVERVRLWQADNPEARDFRLEAIGEAWRSSTLDGDGGRYVGRVDAPARGFRAFFIEVEFDESGRLEADQKFTSGVRVVPDVLPFAGSHCRPFDDVSNLWFNPRQQGQGMQLLLQGDQLGGAWFLYDPSGRPLWVSFLARLDGLEDAADGRLLRFSGSPPGPGYDPDRVGGAAVGSATLRFRSTHSATLSYTLGGVSGALELVPFDRLADADYSDIWYDPTRDGQGVQLLRRGARLSGAWYLYDDDGSPDWVTFQGTLVTDGDTPTLDAELLRFDGPPLGEVWDEDAVDSRAVGRVRIRLLAPDAVSVDYTVDGVGGQLDLVPFRF